MVLVYEETKNINEAKTSKQISRERISSGKLEQHKDYDNKLILHISTKSDVSIKKLRKVKIEPIKNDDLMEIVILKKNTNNQSNKNKPIKNDDLMEIDYIKKTLTINPSTNQKYSKKKIQKKIFHNTNTHSLDECRYNANNLKRNQEIFFFLTLKFINEDKPQEEDNLYYEEIKDDFQNRNEEIVTAVANSTMEAEYIGITEFLHIMGTHLPYDHTLRRSQSSLQTARRCIPNVPTYISIDHEHQNGIINSSIVGVIIGDWKSYNHQELCFNSKRKYIDTENILADVLTKYVNETQNDQVFKFNL
ncbi:hypothetical protein H8356DRAFT_1327434 [Neocallimastix lanati (nom. inval.)]|nr:hypothetical protein H8356DRAFT_1327434 [Neocallimastix sp. JGI-2020a]